MQDGPRNKVVIIVELAIIYLVLFKCFTYSKYVAQLCSTLCDLTDYNSPWNSPDQNTGVGSHCLLQGIFPTQESNPGLSVKTKPGSASCEKESCVCGSLQNVKVAQSCPTLQPHGLHSPWNSPGKNTGVGSLSLLQGIFPTQGLNPGLPHCRQILYQLNHK